MDAQHLAQPLCFFGKKAGILQVEDGRFDIISQQFFRPPGIGVAEDEDFLVEMGIAPQFNGFIEAGNGKAVGPIFRKGSSQLDAAVAIGIGLDDGCNFDVRSDVFPNLTHIMGRCIEINLGPHSPPRKIHGTFISIHLYIAFPYGTFRIGIIIAQGLEAVNKTAQAV